MSDAGWGQLGSLRARQVPPVSRPMEAIGKKGDPSKELADCYCQIPEKEGAACSMWQGLCLTSALASKARLPDLIDRSRGYPFKYEFQINNA